MKGAIYASRDVIWSMYTHSSKKSIRLTPRSSCHRHCRRLRLHRAYCLVFTHSIYQAAPDGRVELKMPFKSQLFMLPTFQSTHSTHWFTTPEAKEKTYPPTPPVPLECLYLWRYYQQQSATQHRWRWTHFACLLPACKDLHAAVSAIAQKA